MCERKICASELLLAACREHKTSVDVDLQYSKITDKRPHFSRQCHRNNNTIVLITLIIVDHQMKPYSHQSKERSQ
jgi:hypothetical protein